MTQPLRHGGRYNKSLTPRPGCSTRGTANRRMFFLNSFERTFLIMNGCLILFEITTERIFSVIL